MSLLGFFRVHFSRWDIAGKDSHSLDSSQSQTTLRQFFASGLLEFLALYVISWQCGFPGSRVGEASHPGPPDILGATLSEANPYTNQEIPVTVH